MPTNDKKSTEKKTTDDRKKESTGPSNERKNVSGSEKSQGKSSKAR